MFPIFQKLGGKDAALGILAQADAKPTANVLCKWRVFGRIPAIRAVVLLDECAKRGIAATYEDDCTLSIFERIK